MTRRPHRAVVVVASNPQFCQVCGARGVVQVKAVPAGGWVTSRCLHCGPDGLPAWYFTERPTPGGAA